MTAQQQFEKFLRKYDPAVAAEAKKSLAKLRKLIPNAVEMVYDNYNAGDWLIAEALKRAKVPIPAGQKRQFLIKSVSAKQRPRRPSAKKTKRGAPGFGGNE